MVEANWDKKKYAHILFMYICFHKKVTFKRVSGGPEKKPRMHSHRNADDFI